MDDRSPTPKKVHPDGEDLEALSKAELIDRLKEQDQYIKQLESKRLKFDKGEEDADLAERLKQQQKDAARRENTLVHRLTTKEQELQEYISQIAELKQAQTQGTTQLKSMLLDPAVNIVFQRMAKDMEESQEKLKQTQNELSAWKFTPDSQTGKRLMARCQMLLQENEELGKTIASGKTAKLEGEIALQKTLVTEMKNNQSELDEFLGDLEEDVEGMQTMIYVLQQQLRESKEQIAALEEENTRLRTGSLLEVPKKQKVEERTLKPENKNQNTYSTKQETDYAAMDTGYYQEKTDSDLEAEYAYEGLYENEDQYQEELEQQQSAEGTRFEENGYKHYDEEYDSQDFKSSYMETDSVQEAMDTDDNKTQRTSMKDHDTNHIPQSHPTYETKNDEGSSEIRQSSYSSSDSTRQHNEDQLTEASQCSRTESRPAEAGNGTDVSSTGSKKDRELTPEKTRIPSPRPTTKISPKKRVAIRAQASGAEESMPSDTNNGSNTKDNSPERTTTNSPLNDNRTSTNRSKQLNVDVKDEEEIAHDNSKSPNGRRASPARAADREPVLQTFLNGVTSTVDDIEDL